MTSPAPSSCSTQRRGVVELAVVTDDPAGTWREHRLLPLAPSPHHFEPAMAEPHTALRHRPTYRQRQGRGGPGWRPCLRARWCRASGPVDPGGCRGALRSHTSGDPHRFERGGPREAHVAGRGHEGEERVPAVGHHGQCEVRGASCVSRLSHGVPACRVPDELRPRRRPAHRRRRCPPVTPVRPSSSNRRGAGHPGRHDREPAQPGLDEHSGHPFTVGCARKDEHVGSPAGKAPRPLGIRRPLFPQPSRRRSSAAAEVRHPPWWRETGRPSWRRRRTSRTNRSGRLPSVNAPTKRSETSSPRVRSVAGR